MLSFSISHREMLSLGQITPYLSYAGQVKRFKPWWEYIADYLSHVLLLVALFSWTFVLQQNGSGVNCLLKESSSTLFWNSIFSRYCSQRCAVDLYNGVLVHYPYLVFLQWMLLLFCQMFWLKLPVVNTKLKALQNIIQSIEDTEEKGKKKKPCRSGVKYRLLFLLEDDASVISYMYWAKSITIFCISTFFLFLLSYGFPMWKKLWANRNIQCFVKDPEYRRISLICPQLVCNVGSGRLMFLLVATNHIVLVLFIFFFALVAPFYVQYWRRDPMQEKLIGEMVEPHPTVMETEANMLVGSNSTRADIDRTIVSGRPGWNDLCFALSLVDTSMPDGCHFIQSFKEILKEVNEIQVNKAQ